MLLLLGSINWLALTTSHDSDSLSNCFKLFNWLTMYHMRLQANPCLYNQKYHRKVFHRGNCFYSLSHVCFWIEITPTSLFVYHFKCLWACFFSRRNKDHQYSYWPEKLFHSFIICLSQHMNRKLKHRCLSFSPTAWVNNKLRIGKFAQFPEAVIQFTLSPLEVFLRFLSLLEKK